MTHAGRAPSNDSSQQPRLSRCSADSARAARRRRRLDWMAPPSAAAPTGALVLWLHGSGETGEASRAQVGPYFSAPELAAAVRLAFPTAPTAPIACYGNDVITAWFGIPEVPITAIKDPNLEPDALTYKRKSQHGLPSPATIQINQWMVVNTVRDEKEVLRAVGYVHEMLDKEVSAGTNPANIFVCGLSQGGALAIASVLLYPKTLGGCAVFSGSVPLRGNSFVERVTPEAKKTPVLWFHGMADGLVLFEAGHAGCAFLQELGMTHEFKTYPTLGHSLVDEELQYFRQWIVNRVGITPGTEAARPSSSSHAHHKDLH